ncbi:hypothetical protein ACF064_01585 [Streptomyces sp. NPDC015492]|uniref:hypothetical protein n=1 Tax=Streptomyces sp. NPDC015492 TaxID=3364958 RepID=UPI0036FCC787
MTDLDPVVAQAVRTIVLTVNRETAFSHPIDKGRAVEALRRLKAAGYTFEGWEVGQRGRELGLTESGGIELGELAAKVAHGVTIRTEPGPWLREDIVETWRTAALQDSQNT